MIPQLEVSLQDLTNTGHGRKFRLICGEECLIPRFKTQMFKKLNIKNANLIRIIYLRNSHNMRKGWGPVRIYKCCRVLCSFFTCVSREQIQSKHHQARCIYRYGTINRLIQVTTTCFDVVTYISGLQISLLHEIICSVYFMSCILDI